MSYDNDAAYEWAYFAAANTKGGFVSFFDDVFFCDVSKEGT